MKLRSLLIPVGVVIGVVSFVLQGPEQAEAAERGVENNPGAKSADLDPALVKEFKDEIEPLLQDYCYDCHGDGAKKGDISMDSYEALADHFKDHHLWLRIWTNVRTQLMPPADEKFQPEEEEREQLAAWIEKRIFKIDPENPDPGRVTIRRLNREEYRNTVEDLVGVRYDVRDNFPPDDTGFGFDTIGDVLTLSPLLLEKYLTASEEIALAAMPIGAGKAKPLVLNGGDFTEPGKRNQTARNMEAEIEHTVRAERNLPVSGTYELDLAYAIQRQGLPKGHTATWRFLVDGKEVEKREIRWDRPQAEPIKKKFEFEAGRRRFEFHIKPETPSEDPEKKMGVQLTKFELKLPGGEDWNLYPETTQRILFKGLPPKGAEERKAYMREVVERFATKAFRRPVPESTLDRLVALALAKTGEKDARFVDGVRFAVTAVLTSPSFLYRSEIQPEPDNPGKVVPVDQYALASRLSYFLWSSAPDDELTKLAGEGKLRENLRAQVDRMVADPKANRMVANFVGQWLQARDLEGISIDVRRILRERNRREADRVFNSLTRRDMGVETELFFAHVLRENRPLMELLTANYSFLNDRLARFYKVPDVRGRNFRRVEFGEEHTGRGGILGQGTFLIVTSNPTRTSPVKRGLFVLDNILGTPAPPAPPDVPELEEVRKEARGSTMRELMELHREKALCKSCHARMDPIGLALENFNALGQWRTEERGKPIETEGKLITGESFTNVAELKTILGTSRKQDFYRCLTEKMLTYALGRGVEYYDAPTVDRILKGLHTGNGGLKDLIYGIVESVPFQKRRGDGNPLAQ